MKKITQNGISFEYAYDTRGNIISEKRGTLTTTYQYDALGQLIRVNDPHENVTWVYEYDRGGNITSKVKYAYTTGTVGTAIETIPYTYGDANWKDKLTSYNGQTITYDAIGNPLNDGIWTYEWQAGRQLKRMGREGQALTFKYDHNGMRVQKVLEHSWYPETTIYTYHGKLLTHMVVEYTDWDEVAHQDNLHFFYDAQGRPVNVEFNGEMYTYLHNLQGDIVAIVDSAGSVVVEYKYDAWGKLLSTTGTLADTLGKSNPFRYRGYVYDEESGLYYLRSRYYNPEWGRFINCDALVLLGTGFHAIRNAFAYCNNRAINYSDPDGKKPSLFLSIINGIKSIAQGVRNAYQEVLGVWGRLTKTEKTLVVMEPKEAMIVKSCQEITDKIVFDRFGGMVDGDKANAFRHALWNALMKQAFLSNTTAKIWADAHEDFSDEELAAAQPWNGFDAFQHREMDYHNNALGRSCVAWYEFWLTPDQIADRIMAKLGSGEGVILVG